MLGREEQREYLISAARSVGFDGPDSEVRNFLLSDTPEAERLKGILEGSFLQQQAEAQKRILQQMPQNKKFTPSRKGFAEGGMPTPAASTPAVPAPPTAVPVPEISPGLQIPTTIPTTGTTTVQPTGISRMQSQASEAPTLPPPMTDPAPPDPAPTTPPTTAPSTGESTPAPTYGSNPNINIPSTPTMPSSNQNVQAAVDKGFVYQSPEGYADEQIPQYEQEMSEGIPQTIGDTFDDYFRVESFGNGRYHTIKWKDFEASQNAPDWAYAVMGPKPDTPYNAENRRGNVFNTEGGSSRYKIGGSAEDFKAYLQNMPIFNAEHDAGDGSRVYAEEPIPLFNEDGTPQYKTDAEGNLIVTGYQTRPATVGSMTSQDAVDPHLQAGEQMIPAMLTEEEGQYLDRGGRPIPKIDSEGQLMFDEAGNMIFETDADGNLILTESTGMVGGTVAVDPTLAGTTYANQTTATDANLVTATDATVGETAVTDILDETTAQTGTSTDMTAAQSNQTAVLDEQGNPVTDADGNVVMRTRSDVDNLNAAQGVATHIDSAATRTIQDGELIQAAANAETARQHIEGVQAAQADPTQQATVRGQIEQMFSDFDATNPPAWAAGALRGVKEEMAARGIGASSIYGQALIQRALESALPIAQADAATFASFEMSNLSNRQNMQMLYAEQRAAFMGLQFDQEFKARVANASAIADVANKNFTAEQQVILENAEMANTMNIANLKNNQALVIAEAAAIASLEQSDLDNRQQAAVQNAQMLLSMDMANLSNAQQTELFKSAEQIQALFTDKAAENAAKQFNATSQNQVDQFFASLGQATNQFNATQANAQAQYNAGQVNTVERFNAELNNQRDQFNAQNQLVIAQSNATWKRAIATGNTAAINSANEQNAKALLGISQAAYENLWQYYGDTMEWAWTSMENERARIVNMAIAELNATTEKDLGQLANERADAASYGGLAASVVTGLFSSGLVGDAIDFIF